MIVDAILDRRDGASYDYGEFKYIHDCAVDCGYSYLAEACDYGSNEDIAEALIKYLKENDYISDNKLSYELIEWIKSVNWVIES